MSVFLRILTIRTLNLAKFNFLLLCCFHRLFSAHNSLFQLGEWTDSTTVQQMFWSILPRIKPAGRSLDVIIGLDLNQRAYDAGRMWLIMPMSLNSVTMAASSSWHGIRPKDRRATFSSAWTMAVAGTASTFLRRLILLTSGKSMSAIPRCCNVLSLAWNNNDCIKGRQQVQLGKLIVTDCLYSGSSLTGACGLCSIPVSTSLRGLCCHEPPAFWRTMTAEAGGLIKLDASKFPAIL